MITTEPRPLTVHDLCLSYLHGDISHEVYRQLEQIYDYLVAVRRHLPEGQDIELFWTATP